jgi:ADP-ribosylation factor-like protein 6
MGNFNTKKKVDLITCGLDNSGKSTIVNYLKPAKERVEETTATIGYQIEHFSKGKVNFKVFDMGGAKKFRELWAHHFRDIQGVVFVIDSADKVRVCLVKNELEIILESKELKNIPILFFANKMDLAGALSPVELDEQLELSTHCAGRAYNIIASNALTGGGIDDGIKWLSDTILKAQQSA